MKNFQNFATSNSGWIRLHASISEETKTIHIINSETIH